MTRRPIIGAPACRIPRDLSRADDPAVLAVDGDTAGAPGVARRVIAADAAHHAGRLGKQHLGSEAGAAPVMAGPNRWSADTWRAGRGGASDGS